MTPIIDFLGGGRTQSKALNFDSKPEAYLEPKQLGAADWPGVQSTLRFYADQVGYCPKPRLNLVRLGCRVLGLSGFRVFRV